MRALITCEVSNEFISALKTRGIEYELTGWGQTGNTLTQEELISKAQGCEIVIVEIEDLNKAVIESLPVPPVTVKLPTVVAALAVTMLLPLPMTRVVAPVAKPPV